MQIVCLTGTLSSHNRLESLVSSELRYSLAFQGQYHIILRNFASSSAYETTTSRVSRKARLYFITK